MGYVREHRGITCSADDVIAVNGAQQALDIVARTLIDKGDRVLMENPTYPGARVVFAALGAAIDSVRVGNGGLDIGWVLRLQHRVKLACVTPSHRFPTGGVMLRAICAHRAWARDRARERGRNRTP